MDAEIKARLDALEADLAAAKAATDEAKAAESAAVAKADAAADAIADLEARLTDALDPVKIKERSDARDTLVAQARTVARDDSLTPEATATDIEIKRLALTTRKLEVEGRDDAYILARFDAEIAVADEMKKLDSPLNRARTATPAAAGTARPFSLDGRR